MLLGALRGPLAPSARSARSAASNAATSSRICCRFWRRSETRGAAATALGLALRGPALDGVPHGQQERAVLDALIAAGDSQLHAAEPIGLDPITRSLGRLPYEDVESFKSAETFLRQVLEKPFPQLARCAARRRREGPRVAREAEPQDRVARRGHDRSAENRRPHTRSQARGRSAQCARGARRGAGRRRRHARGRSGSRGRRGPAPCRAGALRLGIGNRRRRPHRLHPQGAVRHVVHGPARGRAGLDPARRQGARVPAAPRCAQRSEHARRPRRARCARRRLPRRRRNHDADGVRSADATAARPMAARDACVRGAGEARSRARRDQHADLRDAPDLAGADVHRQGRGDRRRRRGADAPGVGLRGQRRRGRADAAAPADRRRQRSVVRRRPESQNAHRPAEHRAPVRGHPHRSAGARRCDADAGAGRLRSPARSNASAPSSARRRAIRGSRSSPVSASSARRRRRAC